MPAKAAPYNKSRSGESRSRESLELIVLSVLSDQALYGYAIIKQVTARSNGAVSLTPGVLYPLLHDLEAQKLILASWETVRSARTDESDGRKRKWYRLSARGRRRLEKRIAAHRAYQAMIDGFIPDDASPEAAS